MRIKKLSILAVMHEYNLMNNICWCYEDELDEHLNPKEIQEHMENIKNICKGIMVDRANDAWEEYLEEIKNGDI